MTVSSGQFFVARAPGAVHALGGLTSSMDIDEWLGGEFGVDTPKPLKARMVAVFQTGVASNVWDMSDVGLIM